MNDVPLPTPRPASAPQAPTPPAATDPNAIGSGTSDSSPTGTTTDSIASPKDQCIIIAGGQQYKDWAQVEVTITQGEPMREGAFVTTEVLDAPGLGFSLPAGQTALQLVPGMDCKIYMGGQLALTGKIYERTANYDHSKHSVLIKCSGDNRAIVRGVVAGPSGKAMKNATWEKYTNAQLKDAGLQSVKMNATSKAATSPFSLIQHIPGEKRFKAIDRYARSAQIQLSESPQGQLVANDIGGPQGGGGGGAELQEGKNILRASCKIWDLPDYRNSVGLSAQKGNDKNSKDSPRNNSQVATQTDSGATSGHSAGGAQTTSGGNAPGPGGGFGGGSTLAASPSRPTVSPRSSRASVSPFDMQPTELPQVNVTAPATSGTSSGSSMETMSTGKVTGAVHSEIGNSDNKTLGNRHDYQNMWEDAKYQIQAEVVVRGWLRDDGRAWDVNEQGSGPQGMVSINAPMLMLKTSLLINAVKLSQTVDEGTLTTLTLGRYPNGESPLPKSQDQSKAKPGTPSDYGPNPDTGGVPGGGTGGGIQT
jgi:prophage tail gpP-like protein